LFDDARDGNIEGMNTALSNGADINWSNTDVAFIQVWAFIGSRCFHEEIRYVPQTQCPIDDTHSPFFLVLNRTPLHIAAASNMSDAVQWLLSQGAAVDSRDD
uniref:Uncharacterized protein n=1 Tax=Amphimedon queenslandica TaxID=400682 RepID=A0A1X7TKR0_AMPQE